MGAVETRSTKHARQLIADIALERREGRLHQLYASSTMLIPRRKSRPAGRTEHEEHHRLFGIARKLVLSQAHWEIKRDVRVIATRGNDMVYAKLVERGPVAQRYMRVHQRRFDEIGQRFFLLLRQLRANVRDHAVVTGENTVRGADRDQFSLAHVCDLHIL